MSKKRIETGLVRIIGHWTGGAGYPSALDKEHYHAGVDCDGERWWGNEKIEDNIVTADDDYAAHTLRLNTGSIGVAACGMLDAQESPFDPGPAPVTEKAFRALARLMAELCMQYGIKVSDKTTITHAEVEPNLGVKQRGKWDFTRLVFRPDLRGAKAVGDYLRELIADHMTEQGWSVPAAVAALPGPQIVRQGSKGTFAMFVQRELQRLKYPVGKIDEIFGPISVGALKEFQRHNGLEDDGICGPATYAAFEVAKPRSAHVQRDHTPATLRKGGSTDVKTGDTMIGVSTATAIPVAIKNVQDAVAVARDSQDTLDWAMTFLTQNWAPLIILMLCVTLALYAYRNIWKRVWKANTAVDVTI